MTGPLALIKSIFCALLAPDEDGEDDDDGFGLSIIITALLKFAVTRENKVTKLIKNINNLLLLIIFIMIN